MPCRPGFGKPDAVAAARLSLQSSGKGSALVECSQRAVEGSLETFIQGNTHEFGRVGMADMAAIPDQIAFVDFPHNANVALAMRALPERLELEPAPGVVRSENIRHPRLFC